MNIRVPSVIRLYLVVTFMFFSTTTFSQQKVTDQHTGKGIAFAAIYKASTNEGCYADEAGNFKLSTKPNDTLILSSVGYKTDTFVVTKNIGSYSLSPKIYPVEEVTVQARLSKNTRELGYNKAREHIGFSSHPGSEYVVFIPNPEPEKTFIIESLLLTIKNKSPEEALFRLHLYAKDSTAFFPGNELFGMDAQCKSRRRIKKIELPEAVRLPAEGIFVGLEWVKVLQHDGESNSPGLDLDLTVPLTFAIEKPYTFFRSKFYDNLWQSADANHPLTQLQNQDNP
ncbi:MAG: carboxypeptidase-like regulatory domain-containing protein, partial [Bacteroidota bacterium]